MTILFTILICLVIGIAASGVILMLPKKRSTSPAPEQGPVDTMVRIKPAGPGKLKMSIPQGDRMPVEVMLQITEANDVTDLDKLKDPDCPAMEKQEVVNRLRLMGYEIAYDPFPEGRMDMSFQGAIELPDVVVRAKGDAPAEDTGIPDSGEGEVDPLTLRSVEDASATDVGPAQDGFSDYLRDTEAIVEGSMEDAAPAVAPPDEERLPTAEDERLLGLAESEGAGALQLPDPVVQAEEGQDGRKAIALMEFLAQGLKNGTAASWVVKYAEDLLNIQILDAPWRQQSRPVPRAEKDFRPLDTSILGMSLDEFDLFARDHTMATEAPPEKDDPPAVTVKDFRHGGRRDLAWDRLDLD